jgi:hypothetical protein
MLVKVVYGLLKRSIPTHWDPLALRLLRVYEQTNSLLLSRLGGVPTVTYFHRCFETIWAFDHLKEDINKWKYW